MKQNILTAVKNWAPESRPNQIRELKGEDFMEKEEMRSGDHLSDVEVTIFIRSSSTDYGTLKKLMNAFVASSTSLLDTKVVTVFLEEKVTNSPGKRLVSLKTTLYVE